MSLEVIILSVILPLLLDEFLQWSSVVARLLIKLSTQGLPEKLRERLQEEWLGELESYPGRLSKLFFALDTFRAAYRIDHNLRLPGTSLWSPLVVRLFDVTCSLAILIMSFPWLLVVFMALLSERRGPVFIWRVFVGRDGKLFTCFKFRSCRSWHPASSASGKAIDESKLEMLIRLLRADELPTLFNVLRGNLSFVGPRPLRPDQFENALQELPGYEERLKVRPGISGLAQINSYSDSFDLEKSLAYDLLYLKQYGLATNLIVIFRTAAGVLFRKE